MNFCDAHLHSTHPPLLSAGDLQPEGFFFSCAAGPDDWEALLKAPGIKPFMGIHPEKIGHDWSGRISELRRLLRDNPAAGVGECGLDGRFYKTLPRKLQEEVLAAQIGLAAEFSRPAALHQVGAPGALADLLGSLSEVRAGSVKLMIHGFKDSPEILKRYLDLGLYISLGPGGHWEKEEFLKTASLIPGDRLLLETDWPY
ncbi:MAG: TatD family hydrolase [Spirochaetales bacterium]|nr:TatD family hydrolase [Spirochaetales bacterium]